MRKRELNKKAVSSIVTSLGYTLFGLALAIIVTAIIFKSCKVSQTDFMKEQVLRLAVTVDEAQKDTRAKPLVHSTTLQLPKNTFVYMLNENRICICEDPHLEDASAESVQKMNLQYSTSCTAKQWCENTKSIFEGIPSPLSTIQIFSGKGGSGFIPVAHKNVFSIYFFKRDLKAPVRVCATPDCAIIIPENKEFPETQVDWGRVDRELERILKNFFALNHDGISYAQLAREAAWDEEKGKFLMDKAKIFFEREYISLPQDLHQRYGGTSWSFHLAYAAGTLPNPEDEILLDYKSLVKYTAERIPASDCLVLSSASAILNLGTIPLQPVDGEQDLDFTTEIAPPVPDQSAHGIFTVCSDDVTVSLGDTLS